MISDKAPRGSKVSLGTARLIKSVTGDDVHPDDVFLPGGETWTELEKRQRGEKERSYGMAINDNCPRCNYPDVGPGQNYKGIYNPGQPCPHCKYNELGKDPKVSDIGRHRTLKAGVAKEIREAFTMLAVSMREAPPEHLALMLARNAIGYLELPADFLQGWYER